LPTRQVNHRHSAKDWMYNVRSLPQSTILREVRNPVLTIIAWSTLVSVLHKLFLRSVTFRHLALHMQVGASAHSFLVSSLGLLLVFRTNSAYQRFAEGRAIWERILSTSRNLSRMINLYSDDLSAARKYRMTRLLAAFPYLLRHHIRPKGIDCNGGRIPIQYRIPLPEITDEPVETRHEGCKDSSCSSRSDSLDTSERSRCWVDKRELPWSLLPDSALLKCAESQNRPLWTCDQLGKEIASVSYNDHWTSRERLTMLGQVDKLSNAIGECERIHQTAVPVNYARHSLRSVSMWLLTLPFALVQDLGLITGPVMGAIAWLLFGVYQIGHSIEDPFQGTLRLSVLCDAIRKDILPTTLDRDTAYCLDDEKNQGLLNGGLLDLETSLSKEKITNLADQTVFLKTADRMNEPIRDWVG